MAEDAGARIFGGSHVEIAKKIRLIIASPVHLVRDGLAATVPGRTDVSVIDIPDLSPRGIAKIANVQPMSCLRKRRERAPPRLGGRVGRPHALCTAHCARQSLRSSPDGLLAGLKVQTITRPPFDP